MKNLILIILLFLCAPAYAESVNTAAVVNGHAELDQQYEAVKKTAFKQLYEAAAAGDKASAITSLISGADLDSIIDNQSPMREAAENGRIPFLYWAFELDPSGDWSKAHRHYSESHIYPLAEMLKKYPDIARSPYYKEVIGDPLKMATLNSDVRKRLLFLAIIRQGSASH